MITIVTKPVKRMRRAISIFAIAIPISVLMTLMAIGLLSVDRAAGDERPANAAGSYTIDGKREWIGFGESPAVQNLRGLTIADIERLFPMTPEEEAAIVHTIPQASIVIDGVLFKPEEISLFNGKRLRFVEGKDGTLYAFTSVEAFEQFIQSNVYGPLSATLDSGAEFFSDWYWTGYSISVFPGSGITDLGPYGFDNVISSTKVITTSQWAYLFDYTDFGGDYYGMAPGSSNYYLGNQGWNDRASSVWVNG